MLVHMAVEKLIQNTGNYHRHLSLTVYIDSQMVNYNFTILTANIITSQDDHNNTCRYSILMLPEQLVLSYAKTYNIRQEIKLY